MFKWSKNTRPEIETGNIGCMWGLIRMLHFRRDPKLLLSQRQSNTQYFLNRCSRSQSSEIDEINDEYDSDEEIKPTVKKLMDEEMKGKTVKRKKSREEIERILSDWGQPEKKKSKQKRPKSKQNPNPNSTESTDFELVLAAFLIEIYRYHNECQHMDCKNKTGLLCPTLKSIVYSKLHDRNNNNINNSDNNNDNFGNNLRVSQSKEFTNALEILSSNKELFLKILQDPDSRVLEKIQEINNKREEKRSLFKRKEQHEGKMDISQRTVSKIVVLKPKATTKASSSYDEKFVSSFSFKEIKRRLKRIIGENSEQNNNLSTNFEGIRKDTNLFKIVTGTSNNNNLYRPVPVRTAGSSFYEEAKKHLAELLENGNNSEIKKKHDSKPLGKIISFKGGNLQKCPDLGPSEDREVEKEVSLSKSEILNEVELERDNCIEENESELKIDRIEMETQHESENQSEEVLDQGSEHTEEPKSDECCETPTQDPELEITEELPTSETVEEVIEEFVTSPKCVNEPSSSCSENVDHTSPISVLDKIFCDEVSIADCRILNYDEVHESPSHSCSNLRSLLEDTNARFEFIKMVIEASELCKEESLERWYMSEELLEPSLIDQLEIDFDQGNDSRLLFDCISEVLIEIQKRFYGFMPSVRMRCNVLNEVCKRVDRNVEDKEPSFLERDWMDVREENEGIVTEIWDELIDDLLEETVFDLWL